MTETGRHFEPIEITPEMIEVGRGALCLFNMQEDDLSDVAHEVYRVMRSLEGNRFALFDETSPASGYGLFPTKAEHRADQQAFSDESAADAIDRIVHLFEQPPRRE